MKKVMRDGAGLISITISGSPIDDDISEAEWLSVGFDTTSWVTASRFDLRNRNVIFIALASEDVFSRNYYQENETDAVDRPSTGSKVTGIGPDDGGATAIEGVNKAVAVNKQSIGGKVTGIGPDDGGVTAVEGVTVSSVLLAENAHLPAGYAFALLAVLSDKYPAGGGVFEWWFLWPRWQYRPVFKYE